MALTIQKADVHIALTTSVGEMHLNVLGSKPPSNFEQLPTYLAERIAQVFHEALGAAAPDKTEELNAMRKTIVDLENKVRDLQPRPQVVELPVPVANDLEDTHPAKRRR